MGKEIPQPTTKEIKERIEAYEAVLKTAEENRAAIETSTFDKHPHLDLTSLTGEGRVDALDTLQEKHRKIADFTIPIFSRFKAEAENHPHLRLEQLKEKRERIRKAVQEGILLPEELIKTDNAIAEFRNSMKEYALSDGESFPPQTELISDRPQFTALRLTYSSRYGDKDQTIPISDTLDKNDLILLESLTKNERSETFISSSDLKKELLEQRGKISGSLSTRITNIRKWLEQNNISPQIIEQSGAKRGTKYRITKKAHLISSEQREENKDSSLDYSELISESDLSYIGAVLLRYEDTSIVINNSIHKFTLDDELHALISEFENEKQFTSTTYGKTNPVDFFNQRIHSLERVEEVLQNDELIHSLAENHSRVNAFLSKLKELDLTQNGNTVGFLFPFLKDMLRSERERAIAGSRSLRKHERIWHAPKYSMNPDNNNFEENLDTQINDQQAEYITPLIKIHPTIKEDLLTFMKVVDTVMDKNQRFTGQQLTNTFRGFSGHWTEFFLEKAVEKGLINLETPKGKRNYHPSFTREDVLAIWYFDTYREIINNPNIKINQLKKIIRDTIYEFDKQKEIEELNTK